MYSQGSSPVDKTALAKRFGKAAVHYDHYAKLQKEVGEHLLGLIPPIKYEVALDLGCGTGFFLQSLQPLSERLLALDLSLGMLQQARLRHALAEFMCADAESLPLTTGSVDLVFTSLAIQWCHSYPALLSELHRVLRPGGVLVFSTLCAGSLDELRRAWAQCDQHAHVNQFVAQQSLMTWCKAQGFTVSTWEIRKHSLQYPDLHALLMGLKGIGASQVLGSRPAGLGGRARMQQLALAYERQRNEDGWLPLSYEVCYGVLVR